MEGKYPDRFRIRELEVFISKRIISSIEERVWRRRQQIHKDSRT